MKARAISTLMTVNAMVESYYNDRYREQYLQRVKEVVEEWTKAYGLDIPQ